MRTCLSSGPFTKQAVEDFMGQPLALPPTLVSDGPGRLTAAAGLGAVHGRIVTGRGVASASLPWFCAVSTVLSNLKAALTGTFHAVKFTEYVHCYLAELQYCFSRRFNLRAVLTQPVMACVGTARQTRRFIQLAEIGF